MPATSLVPKNGAVVLGSYLADFNSFDFDGGQSVENVTPYGTNTAAKNVGSGTPDFTTNITAFALAHAANTAPVIGGTCAQFVAGGVSTTLTLDTGVTEAFTGIVQRFRISHARMRGAVPIAITLKNAGEIVETWAVS